MPETLTSSSASSTVRVAIGVMVYFSLPTAAEVSRHSERFAASVLGVTDSTCRHLLCCRELCSNRVLRSGGGVSGRPKNRLDLEVVRPFGSVGILNREPIRKRRAPSAPLSTRSLRDDRDASGMRTIVNKPIGKERIERRHHLAAARAPNVSGLK